MVSKQKQYDIQELSLDGQSVASVKYRKALYYASQAAIWVFYLYFFVRLALLIKSGDQTWQMWLMLLVEYLFARLPYHDQFLTVAAGTTSNNRPRGRLRLHGDDDLPRVDVLVPCCGEPVEVVMDTIRAACTMDYPVTQFRVLLLDDGASTVLQSAVTDARSQWPHLSYHSRGKQSGRVFAKAGNLNYALFSVQNDDPPQFCAVLDADCMPTADYLRATLPHLLRDPQAALLTTRQYYYNLPTGDPLQQSRVHFYTCHNAELDRMGSALDAGSGAIFRREIVVDLGGYPTFSFSEDWQLSLILRGLGHRIIQVLEPLQLGLVPSSLDGHISQRNRWQIGHSQQPSVLFPSANQSIPKHLQWSITLGGLSIVFGLLGYVVGFAAVPVLVISRRVIPTTSPFFVKVQVFSAVLYLSLTWIHALIQSAHAGFRIPPFAHLENSWLSGAHVWAIIRFHLFSSKPKGSFVTGSSDNSWNRTTSLPFYHKLRRDLLYNGVLLSLILFCAILGLFGWSTYAVAPLAAAQRVPIELLATVAWPPLLHIGYLVLSNLWVPIRCFLDPPKYPERKSRMALTDSGIFFPCSTVKMQLFHHKYPPLGPYNCYAMVPIVLIGIFVAAYVL